MNKGVLSRRGFLKATCGVALGPRLGHSASGGAAAKKPNIIFFLVDDYDKLETSVYGGNVLTPNLDRLAKEGITFHNAHMTSTVCTPSRYTCLTGRYAGSSYSRRYLAECPAGMQGLPAFNVELEDDNMNVGAILAKNGYATGYVGKYHVGPEIDKDNSERYGLHYIPKNCEFSEKVNRQKRENERRHRQLIKERGFTWAKNIYWTNLKVPFKGHNPEWTIWAALEFIEEHKDEPFYLHYCTTLLHGPNGEWFKSLSKPLVTGEGILDEPLTDPGKRESVMERLRKTGLGENEAGYLWNDDSVGMILDKLDELGIADNTIFVFIADHGSVFKGSLYKDRGTEVPCIMRWPSGMKKNVQCHELIQNTDFVPTWFELAGADVPKGYRMDGVSIAPLFSRPERSVRDCVYGEMGPARSVKTKDYDYIALRYTSDQIEAIRAGDNRGIKKLQGLSGGVSRGRAKPGAFSYDQLYDLRRDPLEQRNLAGERRYQGKLREMKALLKRQLRRFEGRPFGEFIPGGNAVPGGGYDDALEKMAKAGNPKGSKPTKAQREPGKRRRQEQYPSNHR